MENTPKRRGPTNRKFTPTKEWLIENYINGELTGTQVRELTGYSKSGFWHLLETYGLDGKGHSLPKSEITYEELYQLHVVEGLTAVKIAAKYNCHNSTVSRLIKQYELDPGRQLVNIPVSPPYTRDELWKLYWVDELSAGDIARMNEVSRSTALRWFNQLDVPRKKWNGGEVHRTYVRSAEPRNRNGYEFCAQEREKIFKRDGYTCRMPGCKSVEQLEVHHITPIKYGGTNAFLNGITLCHSCHDHIRYRELDFVTLLQDLLT
ncbi:MAG: hypothetical protein NVS4B1_33370 [Ktedonobacteraceae bacterium]